MADAACLHKPVRHTQTPNANKRQKRNAASLVFGRFEHFYLNSINQLFVYANGLVRQPEIDQSLIFGVAIVDARYILLAAMT